MAAGAFQIIVGVTGVGPMTLIWTEAVAAELCFVSEGVNTAVIVWFPGDSTVPAVGEYVNVPCTLACASNCTLPSAVPYAIGAGGDQVIVGVVVVAPAGVMVTCVDELRVSEDVVAFALEEATGATSTKAPCTLTEPAALLVSTPFVMVASDSLDTVHCVPEVTSCVEPSLRCAVALSTTAPPTLTVEGVAAIDKD
jgi:hypothetical protein